MRNTLLFLAFCGAVVIFVGSPLSVSGLAPVSGLIDPKNVTTRPRIAIRKGTKSPARDTSSADDDVKIFQPSQKLQTGLHTQDYYGHYNGR
ncbi:hypothetical protein BV898_16452 [Hypsibius exemplaris]|uniref:Uncharacterized protein n=1 Tax=Hypsibius exemplaris TaxID=2072580 RepID=A0A9X6RLU5_HYPEX|nr:hypothetical protein BV898_16452 [Hypsibius exemplaris]